MERKRILLFEAVTQYIFASGGDGWGYIVASNYDELARDFKTWNDDRGYHFVESDTNNIDELSFHDEQEGVTFSSRAPDSPNHMEIVVQIMYGM